MNLAFLPDLSALTILIVVLALQRRRHPQAQAGVWLLGLFFTWIEAIAHTFYAPVGIPGRLLHVVVLDCYLMTGVIFTWSSGNPELPRAKRMWFLTLNTLTLGAMVTTYGLNVRSANAYVTSIGLGLLVGVASSVMLRRSWTIAMWQAAGWTVAGYLVSRGEFRTAVYWALSGVYLVAALNFQQRLQRGSTGRVALVTGFYIWAACFLVHPWVVGRSPMYAELASHIWNMQKSLIAIGMLLLMLERQVSHNQWLALHDQLTGLPNRRWFEDQLAEALSRAKREKGRLAVYMLDLNGFKQINDSMGHLVGDEVLRQVANNLRERLEREGVLARLGGDEFVLIAPGLRSEWWVGQLREAICRAVERPMVVDGQRLSVSASLGLATYPEDAEDAAKLLRIADLRMYEEKPQMQARIRLTAAEEPELIGTTMQRGWEPEDEVVETNLLPLEPAGGGAELAPQ